LGKSITLQVNVKKITNRLAVLIGHHRTLYKSFSIRKSWHTQ